MLKSATKLQIKVKERGVEMLMFANAKCGRFIISLLFQYEVKRDSSDFFDKFIKRAVFTP